MNIVAAFKVVPDDEDIRVSEDGSLDFSQAKGVVSAYDLNAIEAAVQLAEAVEGSRVVAVSVGPAAIDDSKLKKNVLARGADELYLAADDAYADMDSRATAAALARLLANLGPYDVVLCGDGSADEYAQQVDVQLAAALGLPSVNGAVRIQAKGDALVVERALEDVIEVVEMPLPSVVSIMPDAALPRIPGMKDILAAGKKPMSILDADAVVGNAVETLLCRAPEQADRGCEVEDVAVEGALERFAAALKAAR